MQKHAQADPFGPVELLKLHQNLNNSNALIAGSLFLGVSLFSFFLRDQIPVYGIDMASDIGEVQDIYKGQQSGGVLFDVRHC